MGPSFSFDSVNNTARLPLPSQFDFLACDSPRLVIMSSRINVITRTRVGKRGRERDVSVRRADDSCGRNEEGRAREGNVANVAYSGSNRSLLLYPSNIRDR